MRIYISASWKNRSTVRLLASVLREDGHEVYDFTDPRCRCTPELPPEKFPEQFDPDKHNYRDYLENQPAFRGAVDENRRAIEWCDLVILLLPCGIDATADWALGVGLGKQSVIVGNPKAGERSPTHLWANAMLDNVNDVIAWVGNDKRAVG
jgi:hypothetical protein